MSRITSNQNADKGTFMTEINTGEETTVPSDKGFLFFRDNGYGKKQLCIKFPSGNIQVLVTEP